MAGWRERRPILTWVLVFILIVGAPTAYAQNWPPAVIVESSSMMHLDSEVAYGRVGTIDPGDLVLVKSIDSAEDVRTFVEGGDDRYRSAGDVIVYYPANDRSGTPVIHRAMAYVEVDHSDDVVTYRVRWNADTPCPSDASKDPADPRWCVFPADGIYIPDAGIEWGAGRAYRPNANGFITKGDNPVTNRAIDPTFVSVDEAGRPSVVKLDWIEGKARGELPWLGLVKLALAREPNEASPPGSYVRVGSAYAPADLWVSLVIALALILGGPIAFDSWKAMRARRAARP